MKNKIPTAEEVLTKFGFNAKQINQDFAKAMIEFANLHVKAALEAAAEKSFSSPIIGKRFEQEVNKDSILNAYPETNIK